MPFRKRFQESQISEWSDFYINYDLYKTLISPFKRLGKCNQSITKDLTCQVHFRHQVGENGFFLENFDEGDIKILESFLAYYEVSMFNDLKKVVVL